MLYANQNHGQTESHRKETQKAFHLWSQNLNGTCGSKASANSDNTAVLGFLTLQVQAAQIPDGWKPPSVHNFQCLQQGKLTDRLAGCEKIE